MKGTILAADIGTSSLKAAFIDTCGCLLAFSRTAYRPDSADAQSWERAFALALEELHSLAPDCGIDAVCISGNGPTLVPLKGDGEALPPLYWHDGKTLLPTEISTDIPKEGSSPSFFLPHAAWLKNKAPEDYRKTSLFVSSHEWLAFRLGAEALTVLPHAAYEPYYWDDEQCRLFGLDREKFPSFVKMGSPMGHVSAKAASFFGNCCGHRLKSGTPIIAGGPDFITALIGTGTFRPGDVCDRAGSSEGINVCAAAKPCAAGRPAEAGGLRALPHAKEGLWNISALIPSSGMLFDRYRELSRQQDRPYGELLAELIPSSDNTEIFHDIDFFNTELFPLDSKAPLLPHSPLPTPHSLLSGRSVLCAMAFAVRSAAEKLERAGFPVNEMKVSGGQGKNPRWNQLKADIAGLSLVIPEISDGELAGNAVLAAAALGNAGIEDTMDRMIRFREVYRPRNTAFWEERFRHCRQKAEELH